MHTHTLPRIGCFYSCPLYSAFVHSRFTRVFELAPLNFSLDQGIFRGIDTLHKRVYELSFEHIKTINALGDKYGRYADTSPDFEKPPVHIITGN